MCLSCVLHGKKESKQVGSMCVCHVSYTGRKNPNKLVVYVCLSCVLHGKKESKQVGSMCVCHVSYMGRKNQNKLVICVCLSCVLHGKKESKQVGSMCVCHVSYVIVCVFVMCLMSYWPQIKYSDEKSIDFFVL